MKKIIFILSSLMILFPTSIVLASETESMEIKKVAGPDDEKISAYSITFPYSTEDIENAIIDKLTTEGLSYRKAKNNFYAFKGVRYNTLWTKMFDFYIAFSGSESAGTIYFIMSTGYNNYIGEDNAAECKVISKWLTSLDRDVRIYLNSNKIKQAEKELASAENELEKLKKEQSKLEKKINSNDVAKKKFDAKRTIVDKKSVETIDTELLEEEKTESDKYIKKGKQLNYQLTNVNSKIKLAEQNVAEKRSNLDTLKENRP